MNKPFLISIVGPTAVGKTALSIELASMFETEIISADSRQFYKEMTIGTAKPTQEELRAVPHHFINSHSIEELYSAGEYGRDALDVIDQVHKEHALAIAVGGSGLYLKAIWEGFDEMPEVGEGVRVELNAELEANGVDALAAELLQKDPVYHAQVDLQNGQRLVRALEVIRSTGLPFSSFRKASTASLPYQHLKIGLNMEREVLFDRINIRMDMMIEEGLFEEAEKLYPYRAHNALQTVGYSEIFDYLDGAYDREEAIRLLKRNSRRYAKRQLTWFRKYDDVHWFEPSKQQEIVSLIRSHIPHLA